MGLPSGTLWAAVNLGARNLTDAGLFYQWGALAGHIDASEFDFTQDNYELQSLDQITEDLSVKEDTAAVYFGDPSIRMPSRSDYVELFYGGLVTISSKTINGVRCMTVQSVVTGNTLYFPAIMGRYVGSTYQSTSYPHFWTRNYVSESLALAITVSISSSDSNETRWNGLTIRPVKKP